MKARCCLHDAGNGNDHDKNLTATVVHHEFGAKRAKKRISIQSPHGTVYLGVDRRPVARTLERVIPSSHEPKEGCRCVSNAIGQVRRHAV